MRQSEDFLDTVPMNDEAWSAMLRPLYGRHSVAGVAPGTSAGWLRRLSVSGLMAMDICCDAHRFERTDRDVRLDARDHYKAVFQIAGRSTFYQNDQCVQLAVGDIALIDVARPVTCVAGGGSVRRLSLNLPRQSLVSHLGFEPQGGAVRRSGTAAGRLLYEMVLEALNGEAAACPPVDSYMQLAVYNLLGALFAPSESPSPSSGPASKLFMRIRRLIKERFADPDFGPPQAASATGISLRYLQKLFTQRGFTCTEFIYSLRLNQAARLLDRRKLLSIDEPISAIAYACGFRDYTHFARRFRRRFGYSPGDHADTQVRAETQGHPGNGAAPFGGTDERASWARDV